MEHPVRTHLARTTLACLCRRGTRHHTMHTYLYRINTLFTIASTTLAVICVATSLTDWTIKPDPQVKLTVQSLDGLQVSCMLWVNHGLDVLMCNVPRLYPTLHVHQPPHLACRKNTGTTGHGLH